MIRLTRRVLTDLAIWMIGLGVAMGIVFPCFITLMGVPSHLALRPWFVAACITAGFAVGAANIALARVVVGRRLRLLASGMRFVESNLKEMTLKGNVEACTTEACRVVVDSEDEIGESARAFNALVASLADSLQTTGAVRAFTETVASQLDLAMLAREALQQLLRYTASTAGAILIEGDGRLEVAAAVGIRNAEHLAGSDHVRLCLRSEQRQRVTLPDAVVVDGVLTDFRPREVVVDPVLYKRVPLGVIVLASAEGFSEEALGRLDLLRRGLALAFSNALTHDRLQRLAAIDPLTGLFNRRFGSARLREEFSRAVRGSSPLGVIMFDIDHFKSVNDTYGHLAGDRVLVAVARAARAAVREGDVVVRYGGEEFLAIVPGASRADGAAVAERLRRHVEETVVSDGDQEIHITISLGVTAFPEVCVDEETALVQRADEAMYAAKETGRNRVVVR